MPNRLKLLYIENLLILIARRLYICNEIKSCKNRHNYNEQLMKYVGYFVKSDNV